MNTTQRPRCGHTYPHPRHGHCAGWSTLTKPQAALLARIRDAGSLVLNGRARRTIEALEAAGLVHADYDMRAQVKGNGIELVQRITVSPVEALNA